MLLSNYLLSGGVKPYLEYAWVCAPNAAGQSITPNTITTLTIDTEVADTGNNGSIAGNQITLAAGTYYFEANVRVTNTNGDLNPFIFSLYNTSDSSYISRIEDMFGYNWNQTTILKGQFTISSSKNFVLQLIATTASGTIVVRSGDSYRINFTNSTAGADQRTTIKLWKLA
jgi:hypothetical protein